MSKNILLYGYIHIGWGKSRFIVVCKTEFILVPLFIVIVLFPIGRGVCILLKVSFLLLLYILK